MPAKGQPLSSNCPFRSLNRREIIENDLWNRSQGINHVKKVINLVKRFLIRKETSNILCVRTGDIPYIAMAYNVQKRISIYVLKFRSIKKGIKDMRKPFIISLTFFILIACSSLASANLVTNPGFEDTSDTTYKYGHPGLPDVYGDWAGDYSQIIVDPQDSTNHVLQFLGTGIQGTYTSLSTSEIYQLIDISSYAAQIASGNMEATLTGYFNRVAGDPETDTGFSVTIYAFDGTISGWSPGGYTQVASGSVYADSDMSTWEQAGVTLLLDSSIDFIAIRISAGENITNDSSYPEFDGHYADNISFTLQETAVPVPASLLLLSAGIIGLSGIRRRGKNR